MGGGMLLSEGSKYGDGSCGLVDIAVCDGLALFWVVDVGDWTDSEPLVPSW